PKGWTVDDLYKVVHAIGKDHRTLVCGVGKYPTFVHMDIRPGDRLIVWHGSRAWAETKGRGGHMSGILERISSQEERWLLCGLFMVLVMAFSGPVLLAQAAVAAGAPTVPVPGDESVASFIWAYAGAAMLQAWKKSRFAGFSYSTEKYLKR